MLNFLYVSSRTYKIAARDAFENAGSRTFTLANDVLAVATVISVLAIVLETVESFSPYHSLFKVIEYTTVALFTAEYLGRLWIAKNKLRYVFSFFGLIDLLAIIPTYLSIGNLTFLKTSRALRILRFLRMIRLAKLARMRRRDAAQSVYSLNIQIYGLALLIALLVLGTLLFIFEGHQSPAQDIPSAMYWAFKIILGGIPYDQPHTTIGTGILIAARFTSMILLGLMLSLVGTMTRKILTGSEKDA